MTGAHITSIDADAVQLFLQALGKNGDTRMRGFSPWKHGGRKHRICLDTALQWQLDGISVYIVINDGGDTDDSITSCRALFCEWDDRPIEWQVTAWQELGLPEPSLQVDSGGKSIHNYWIFHEPITVDQWRTLQERLICHASSDPALKNPSRVMRLPGTWHLSPGATQPEVVIDRLVQVVHASEHRYSFDQLNYALKPLPQPEPQATQHGTASTSTTSAGTIHISELLPKEQAHTFSSGVSEGGRNDECFKLAINLLGIQEHCTRLGTSALGFQLQGSAAECLEDFNRRCSPPLPAAELQTILASASQSQPKPDQNLESRIAFHRRRLGQQPSTKNATAPGTKATSGAKDFILLANNTLQRLKDGIAAINDLPTPAARTAAQYTLRGELGLDKDGYKQLVQDLLEEQEAPAPTSFEELMKLDTGVQASIDDLAAQGTLTLVAAEGHAGKTSLFYRMGEAISTGDNFAGKFKTTQGTALIYQLDESPTDAITKFRRMSIEPDPSRFIPKWKLSPSMIPELEQDIRHNQPVAVFADSLMRIFGGRGISLNDAEFGIWLYQLNAIASRYGTSFFLSHHLKKPETQKRTRVSKHDLFGTAFLFNGTSDCWGLYPSEQEGARTDEFSLEFLKARSGIQEVGTVFNFQGSQEDYSWEFMGVQGQTETLDEKKFLADQVRDLLALKGGEWTAQEVADCLTLQGRPISSERARTTLIRLFERRQLVDRCKRPSAGGRPAWKYFSTSPRA